MNRRRDAIHFYLMTAPALVGFIAFVAGPMAYSLFLSFCRYEVISPPQFIGWQNYKYLLADDPTFWPSLAVTGIYAAFSVPCGILLALGFALLLNSRVRFLGVYRTIFYLPSILPAGASGVLWVWIFNPQYGLLNAMLRRSGVASPPAWTSSPDWALPALIIMSLWGFGGGMIILLAGLQGVPRQLYEAADIDGATWWQQFRHVTFPMLSPVLFFNVVMGLIGALKVFDTAFVFGAASGMLPGGPARATLFFVLNLYIKAFNYFHMGLASAMAWILFLIIGALTLLNFWAGKKWVYKG